jgi:hypothetical protein
MVSFLWFGCRNANLGWRLCRLSNQFMTPLLNDTNFFATSGLTMPFLSAGRKGSSILRVRFKVQWLFGTGFFSSLRHLNPKRPENREPSSWPTLDISNPGRDRKPFRPSSYHGRRQWLLLGPGQIASIPLCSFCPDIQRTSEWECALSCSSSPFIGSAYQSLTTGPYQADSRHFDPMKNRR